MDSSNLLRPIGGGGVTESSSRGSSRGSSSGAVEPCLIRGKCRRSRSAGGGSTLRRHSSEAEGKADEEEEDEGGEGEVEGEGRRLRGTGGLQIDQRRQSQSLLSAKRRVGISMM